jgi:hypothetical protein
MDLDNIITKDPAQLTDEEKTFLTDNAAELEDEVATKYGVTKPSPAPINPEVRGGPPESEKPKEDAGGGKSDDDDEEDEIRKLSKSVDEKLNPIQQRLRESEDILEVDTFIRQNESKIPNVGKYRDAILTYMKNPAYAKIPAKNIFNIVAGDDLIKLGAQKEREAADRARNTQIQSSGGRATEIDGSKKDWSTATKEEYEAERVKVLGRQG